MKDSRRGYWRTPFIVVRHRILDRRPRWFTARGSPRSKRLRKVISCSPVPSSIAAERFASFSLAASRARHTRFARLEPLSRFATTDPSGEKRATNTTIAIGSLLLLWVRSSFGMTQPGACRQP